MHQAVGEALYGDPRPSGTGQKDVAGGQDCVDELLESGVIDPLLVASEFVQDGVEVRGGAEVPPDRWTSR